MKPGFCASIICFGFGIALPRDVSPQDKPSEKAEPRVRTSRPTVDLLSKAREELLDLRRKIRSVETQASERRKSAEESLRGLALEKSTRERAVASLSERAASHEKDLAAKKESLVKEEKEANRLRQEVAALTDPVRQFLDRLQSHVEGGIPWRIDERKRRIAEARELVANRETEPARALLGAGRLEEEEEALGRIVEPGIVAVEVAGEHRALPALRLGLLAVLYSSTDGSVSGCAVRGQKVEDGLDTRAPDQRKEPDCRPALDVLQRRLTPRIVDLYLPSLPLGVEDVK